MLPALRPQAASHHPLAKAARRLSSLAWSPLPCRATLWAALTFPTVLLLSAVPAEWLTDASAIAAAPVSSTVNPAVRSVPSTGSQTALSPLAAQAMYQELENLTGRLESRYLYSRAQGQPTELRAIDPTLTASRSGTVPGITPLPAELQAAQTLLGDWQQMINQGDHATARSRWQSVTQSLQNSSLYNAPAQPIQIAGNRRQSQSEIRAMWLDRETIVEAGSAQGLAKVFERMKAAGINTVFVETVNAGYPIYPSDVAPQQNPLIRNWDPLAAAIELGKAHNMEVHAWVWLFAAGNQAHNPLVGQPASYPGPLLSARPDWAGYDNRGNLIPAGQTKPFLDPANPEVRQYLLDLLGEVARRYDVDGIQFDYVRYPFQDPEANRHFGYGTAARQQFQQLTGVDPITLSPQNGGDPRQAYLWNQWTSFRIYQISSFVAEASESLRRQRPGLTISAAVFADDTRKRQQVIQQDWEDWADQGLVDWIVLMSYASNTQQFANLIRPWVLESSYRSTLVLPGIRLLNLPTAVAADQLQLLRDWPSPGYALFAADNLTSDIQALLARSQGENSQASFSSRNSYATALARYQDLQQEWNWLLTNQQIQGAPERIDQWVAEANQLGQALERLAEVPSERDLLQVRSRLTVLERSLTRNLTVTTASTPYRLRTWQNRLTAIERLLISFETLGDDRRPG